MEDDLLKNSLKPSQEEFRPKTKQPLGQVGRSTSETDYSSSTSSLPSLPGSKEDDTHSTSGSSQNISLHNVENTFVQLARAMMKSTNQGIDYNP